MRANWMVFIVVLLIQACGDEKHYHSSASQQELADSLQTDRQPIEGERTGSGGDAWVCRDPQTGEITSVELWDFVELKLETGREVDLGGEELSIKDKVVMLSNRLAEVDSQFKETFSLMLPYFSPLTEGTPSKDNVVRLLELQHKGSQIRLRDIKDSSSFYELYGNSSCGLVQIARQSVEYRPFYSFITIDPRYVQHMDKDHIAGLINHEILIRYYSIFSGPYSKKPRPPKTTDDIRFINGLYSSSLFQELSEIEKREVYFHLGTSFGLAINPGTEQKETYFQRISAEYYDSEKKCLASAFALDNQKIALYQNYWAQVDGIDESPSNDGELITGSETRFYFHSNNYANGAHNGTECLRNPSPVLINGIPGVHSFIKEFEEKEYSVWFTDEIGLDSGLEPMAFQLAKDLSVEIDLMSSDEESESKQQVALTFIKDTFFSVINKKVQYGVLSDLDAIPEKLLPAGSSLTADLVCQDGDYPAVEVFFGSQKIQKILWSCFNSENAKGSSMWVNELGSLSGPWNY